VSKLKRLKEEIENCKKDVEAIRNATSYERNFCHLNFGSQCDSSSRKMDRMSWVRVAEEKFVKEHQKEILNLAAKLLEEDIGEYK